MEMDNYFNVIGEPWTNDLIKKKVNKVFKNKIRIRK